MSAKNKKYVTILIALSLLMAFTAVYFAVKVHNLTTQVVEQTAVITESDDVYNTPDIAVIDSLLFAGNYTNALKLSVELRQSNRYINDSALQLRYNLAQDVVATKKAVKKSVPVQSFAPVTSSVSTMNAEAIKDSISIQLKEKDQQLALMAEKLNQKPLTEYLTFETTKGTSLHYIGEVDNGNANGYGIAILESGSRYEGQWYKNKREGLGKFFWNDGEIYEGKYKNDKREGLGTYYWKNGEKYVGQWKDDKRNGNGEFYNKKGKLKTKGVWEDDVLITQEKKSH